MTLIELIITLSIMAAVASIALVTLSDMGATNRYEETERRGLAAQQAVIGRPGEISRFFNDMGRYPMVLTNGAEFALAELYNRQLTADMQYDACSISTNFSFNGTADTSFPTNYSKIEMNAGWRGPYLLNRNDSFKTFTDNWGQSWLVSHTNLTTDFSDYSVNELIASGYWFTNVVAGDEIRMILSEGRGDDYAGKNQVYPFYESSVFGNLHLNLKVLNTNAPLSWVSLNNDSRFSSAKVRVFLYLPYCEPDEAPELCEIAAWHNTSTNGVRYRPAFPDAALMRTTATWDGSIGSLVYTDVPVGVRKIWAYAVGNAGTNWMRPQTVEIKPGDQALTLYLNETL